jgi:OOP family OmpA-OmpF porin
MLKNVLFTVIVIFSVNGLMAQNKLLNPWSIGLNDGIVGSMNEIKNIESFNSSGIRLYLKYSLNANFGVMALTGYNTFSTSSGIEMRTKYVNTTLEAVYTLSNLFKLKSKKLSLLLHAGPGLGTFWNTHFTITNPSDPFFKDQDDVFNLNLGLTPQYAITENIHLNLDFSYSYNFKQNHAFDYISNTKKTGMIYNLSVGLNFSLRKKIVKMNLTF